MRLHLLSPGDPAQRTGGYLYNARLVAALRAQGHVVAVHALDGAWPSGPLQGDLPEALHDGAPILADGLLWTGLARPDLAPRTAVLVHSLLGAEAEAALQERERVALAGVRGRIATGPPTWRALEAWGLPCVRAVPGTSRRAPRPPPGGHHALMLATVTPRKQVARAVEAVASAPPWRLTVAGALHRDPEEVDRVRRRIAALGVTDRVDLVGELDDDGVFGALEGADLLLHSASYEAWGMALSEAMAAGVPVLTTPAGAAEGGGARVVPVEGLGAALRALVEPGALEALAAEARARAAILPTWADTARYVAAMLESA